MKTFYLAFFLLILTGQGFDTRAQDKNLFEKHWLVQGADTLPFRVLLPANFDSKKKYPLVFFLHGAGERGRDNETQLVHGSKLFLADDFRQRFPAIVIFPQCPNTSYWSNVLRLHDGGGKRLFSFLGGGEPTAAMKLLMLLVKQSLSSYPVKKDQVYIGGLSMGGMGTYEVVRRLPETFAAAFAICGGASPSTANELKNIKWWLFHGLKDDVVDPLFTKNMEAALKKAGASVKATYYPDANHNSWDPAFAEKDLLPWLFSHKRKEKRMGEW